MININILKALQPCGSSDDTREYLKGVHIKHEIRHGKPFVVYSSTNGHMLAQCFHMLEVHEKDKLTAESLDYLASKETGIIFSRNFIARLPRGNKHTMPFEKFLFFKSDGKLSCEVLQATFNIKAYNIDGTFPDVNKVTPEIDPKGSVHSMMLDSTKLDCITRALHACAKELNYGQKHNGVVLTFKEPNSPIHVNLSILREDNGGSFLRGLLMGMRH